MRPSRSASRASSRSPTTEVTHGRPDRIRGSVELRRIHHVAMAVEDLDEAVSTYERLFGAQVEMRGRMDDQGVEAAYLLVGDGRVELVTPLADDTPVGRFLAKRGPGMHHVAFEVEDVA